MAFTLLGERLFFSMEEISVSMIIGKVPSSTILRSSYTQRSLTFSSTVNASFFQSYS
jgi:hypothetical protein